jgi:hypothetical protein
MGRGKRLTMAHKAIILAKKTLEDKPMRLIAKDIDKSSHAVFNYIHNNNGEIETYRSKILKCFKESGFTEKEFTAKCMQMLECSNSQILAGGKLNNVPDNTNQLKTLCLIKDIIGADAPKEIKQDISLKLDDKEAQEISLIKKRYALTNN